MQSRDHCSSGSGLRCVSSYLIAFAPMRKIMKMFFRAVLRMNHLKFPSGESVGYIIDEEEGHIFLRFAHCNTGYKTAKLNKTI